MAINTGLAQLSESLWTAATGTYLLAMVGYTGEYSFGRKGKVATTSSVRVTSLVGATAGSVGAGRPASSSGAGPASGWNVGAGRVEVRRASGDRWGRAAVALTILGAVLHLASVTIRGAAVDRVPWGNMYEFTLVVGLIAVVAWLGVLARSPGLRYLGLFVMLPVLIVMFLAGTLYTKASKLVPALQSYWLAIHVSSIAVAEGILMTSAALTTLYLVRVRYERSSTAASAAGMVDSVVSGASGSGPATVRRVGSGRLGQLGSRLPASASLDKAAYRTVAFAFPIYTAGVIFGAIWAEAAWGRYWGWDPKEVWAFIAWVVYAMYLHARATAGWKGNRAAYINLLGFAAMTFNFFVVNIVISGLHSYAGLS
jgi:cytochrome c-type biogenesis protein CcsB